MDKSEFSITNLSNTINSLQGCIEAYKTNTDEKMREFIEDSCVKRFEFTVETAWKTMKKYLKLFYGRSDKELTMNNIFRLMEGYGFIKSWASWKNYYEKRNDTSHEYNREKAVKILELTEDLLADTIFLRNELRKALGE